MVGRGVPLARLLLAAVLLGGAVSASPQGPWTGPFPSALWVDPVNGVDTDGGGTLPPVTGTTPLKTIQRAVDEAALWTAGDPTHTATGRPMTINLIGASGPFLITSTIRVPAFGVALEAYGPGVPLILLDPSVTHQSIDVFELRDVLAPPVDVARIPVTSLPPTLFNGLHIMNGNHGILIAPLPSATSGSPTVRVEVRDCEIDHNVIGVRMEVSSLRHECVIEHNSIHHNFNAEPFGVGVDVHNGGVTSSLVRANRLFTNEINLRIINVKPDANQCRDRVFSNFIDDAEWNVELRDCATRLTSNTIAFARPHSGAPAAFGVRYESVVAIPNRRLTLLNNIIWNPSHQDIFITGPGGLPILEVLNNDIENGPEDVLSPLFVGSGGNFSVQPPFTGGAIPERLHIGPVVTSPAICGGADPAFLRAPPPNPAPFVPVDPTLVLTVGGVDVRIDVPCDIDLDPRHVQMLGEPALTPDVGADEIAYASLVPGAGVDSLGNIRPTPSWTGIVSATSPAPTSAFLFLCPSFSSGPVDQHLFLAPFGDAQLDAATSVSLFALPTGGQVDFALTFGPFNLAFLESELFVQAAVFDAGGTTFTNRMRLELEL